MKPILKEDPDDFTLFILIFWILWFRYEAISSRTVYHNDIVLITELVYGLHDQKLWINQKHFNGIL